MDEKESETRESESTARNRKFYVIPDEEENFSQKCSTLYEVDNLLSFVSKGIIGKDKVFNGPFGPRNVTYLDYTASGKSLSFIEDYIRNEVLPEYGNTHTTTSVTSLQTTLYRHEARDIIRNAVNAGEHDAVIFVGSGCTGAVHKLIHSLDLQQPPVVFVGPYEHHSNFLPWREIGSQVVQIKEDESGLVDVSHLTGELQKWQSSGRQLIGCFSAASNVTGVLSDVDAVTVCLHQHGALAFWDYATAAPYVRVDMNPVTTGNDQSLVCKDAIFISMHKFVGGVSTPGVLVAKKSLFRHRTPEGCGGGSVFFVRGEGQRYLQEPELREEGGTPAIVGSIRAGLVMQLKEALSSTVIMEREEALTRKAFAAWQNCPGLVILGNEASNRLPIFSFLVYHGNSGMFLHHNFVTALLNDVFGIQARGGCACAGPYAQSLLGISEELAEQYEKLLAEDSRLDRIHLRRYTEYSDREILRPGFTRINLPYFMTDKELEFVTEAIKIISTVGWKLLPKYMFNPQTGEWKARHHQLFKDRKWLGHISYALGEMTYRDPFTSRGQLPDNFQDCLQQARHLCETVHKSCADLPDHSLMFDEESSPYRWFLLPSEAQTYLKGHQRSKVADVHQSGISVEGKIVLPFCPPKLSKKLGLRVKSVPKTTESNQSKGSDSENSSKVISAESRTPFFPSLDSFRTGMVKTLQNGYLDEDGDEHMELDSGPDGCDTVSSEKSSACVREPQEVMSCPSDQELVSVMEFKQKDSHIRTTDTPEITSKTATESADCVSQHSSIHEQTDAICSANRISSDGVFCCKLQKQSKSETVSGAISRDKNSKKANQKRTSLWHSPGKKIFNPFIEAVEEYGMLKSGDRVLVCLSGGKDSLSLLHTIRQYQFYARSKGVEFEFGAVTVDPQTPAYDPSPLKVYLANLRVPYFYESQGILESAAGLPYECASICSFCSRMKRGRIYACARREGYNVLALGQHLDDLTESFLMSFFHNGILRTMKAAYTVQEGDLRVIRPFVYVREKALREFAEEKKLPVIAENCPACFEAPKERHRIKQLLASQEILHPQVYNSMMAAMKPIMAINRTGVNVGRLLQGIRTIPGAEEEEEQ